MKHEKYPYTKQRTFFLLLQISQLTNKIKDGICQTAPVKTSAALTTEPKGKHLKSLACHKQAPFIIRTVYGKYLGYIAVERAWLQNNMLQKYKLSYNSRYLKNYISFYELKKSHSFEK